jgi:hypothetical protein
VPPGSGPASRALPARLDGRPGGLRPGRHGLRRGRRRVPRGVLARGRRPPAPGHRAALRHDAVRRRRPVQLRAPVAGRFGGRARCVPAPCACLDESTRGPLDDALVALTGLTRCDAIFTRESMDLFPENLRADGWRLPFYDRIHRESPRALGFGRALTTQWAAAERRGRRCARAHPNSARPCSARRSPRPRRPGRARHRSCSSRPGPSGRRGAISAASAPRSSPTPSPTCPPRSRPRRDPALAAARVAVARDAMLTAAGYRRRAGLGPFRSPARRHGGDARWA